MLLKQIQELLGRIYDTDHAYDVYDFLITDAQHARRLDTSPNPREVSEKLLVMQTEEEINLSLFVDQMVLDRLSDADPMVELHPGNLGDFWTALEGVSHFVYLTWNVTLERAVTLHELEMQAEVDKFAATLFVYGEQTGLVPGDLHHWLFERPVLDSSLDPSGIETYRSANRYAGRYCRDLERRYLTLRRTDALALLRELRQFYRFDEVNKIRRIDSALYAR